MPTGACASGSSIACLHWDSHPRVLCVGFGVHVWLPETPAVCVTNCKSGPCPQQLSRSLPAQKGSISLSSHSQIFSNMSQTPSPALPLLSSSPTGSRGCLSSSYKGFLKFFLLGWSCGKATLLCVGEGTPGSPKSLRFFASLKFFTPSTFPNTQAEGVLGRCSRDGSKSSKAVPFGCGSELETVALDL